MTRSIKARFCQVGDQVSEVKDQVGQGQGQELDNIPVLLLLRSSQQSFHQNIEFISSSLQLEPCSIHSQLRGVFLLSE